MKQSQTRELERIVTQATNEMETIEQQKPKAYEKKEDKDMEIKNQLHYIDRAILKHRKEDFEANKKFGEELRAIHYMLNKRQLLLFLIVFFSGFSIGGTVIYFFEDIAPFLGYAIESAKTASNIIK